MTSPINFDRYPLQVAAQRAAILRSARETLIRDGMVTLDDFMTQIAVRETLRVAAPKFATESFEHKREHNIYFQPEITGVAPDHPALATLRTANRTLCADQLAETPLMGLYEDADFIRFLADLMDKPGLYAMDDPLARVNMTPALQTIGVGIVGVQLQCLGELNFRRLGVPFAEVISDSQIGPGAVVQRIKRDRLLRPIEGLLGRRVPIR